MTESSLAGPYKVLTGYLSNAIYRGASIQLRIFNDSILQVKYEDDGEDDWQDLVDLKLLQDYESLLGKPTINGKEIIGEIEGEILSPSDALTNLELEEMLI